MVEEIVIAVLGCFHAEVFLLVLLKGWAPLGDHFTVNYQTYLSHGFLAGELTLVGFLKHFPTWKKSINGVPVAPKVNSLAQTVLKISETEK